MKISFRQIVKIFLIITAFSMFGCMTRPSSETPPAAPSTQPLQSTEAKSKSLLNASFYGSKDGLHGKRTASGEKFNAHGLTAAHRTFPFGTMLRVTNVENDKSVEVRVNDRGPFIKGRDIDLSFGAAKLIGITGEGVKKVRVEVINTPSKL